MQRDLDKKPARQPPSFSQWLERLPRPDRTFTLTALGFSASKSNGWIEALIAKGLVRREDGPSRRFRVTSESAYQALNSLAAREVQLPGETLQHVSRLPDRAGWTAQDLYQLEVERVAANQAAGLDAQPLRWERSALVIVKAIQPIGDFYLLGRRPGWDGFGLIGGKFDSHRDRSLADTAHREMLEELPLQPDGFRVVKLPVESVLIKTVSKRLGVLTEYRFEFFQLRDAPALKVGEPFAWFEREWVFRGETQSGESLNHLAYASIHHTLWEELPGGLDGLPTSFAT